MPAPMKNKIGILLLALLSIVLLIVLLATRKQAAEQKSKDADTILTFSNKWDDTVTKLNDQKQVNATLEKDMENQKKMYDQAILDLTNKYTQTADSLAKTEVSLKASQEEVAKRDARIAELESMNQALDKKSVDLSAAITNLTAQIADTQKKLAASEGDKAFLEKELKRLMAEKAELERQFNDLAVLRAQVAKLKEELNIARRLEWIRQGLFASSDQKGAQKLMQGLPAPQSQTRTNKPSYDLNVEVRSDGSVKIIPPATNAPAPAAPK
jgi:chromosome segregation ATPase